MTDMLTLAGLATRPLWVAWQTEDRENGKPTKVPYAPGGGKAKADDPATWGVRPDAEKRAAALPKPYGAGGVGIEFAPLGDGRSLAGIDLDTCRNLETGAIEGWAEDVIATFDSYAELSPSGTGAKLFCTYDTAVLPALQHLMGGAKYGKQFKRGGGDHPPAIELHLGNRYFAVTDDIMANARKDLRNVPLSIIEQLIRADGPSFAGAAAAAEKPSSTRSTKASLDRSRSSTAFRVGKRAVGDGATFDQMCEALRGDPDTSAWMTEKGAANDYREARRIFDKAKDAGPLIRVVAGELHNTADAAEAAIIAANLPIFQRGISLVRPVVQEVPAARGRMTLSAALHDISTHSLVDALCGCATWEKYDARAEDWLRINPPLQIAETVLSRRGLWTLPRIVGVVTCPTLRPDGSILSALGYDADTRLYHAADATLKLAKAVEQPTRRAADASLDILRKLLAEFPFVDSDGHQEDRTKPAGVSEAVALSALITPTVRGAMPVVPMHAFTASTAGTGKSYMVDTAAAIATGRPCPVASAAQDEAETEKRIAGLLLGGFPLASLDNVTGDLGGDLLCQAIERPLIRIRRLGGSDIIEIESRCTMFATGNALRVRGDMTRRTLLSRLDAYMERPETREFAIDPVACVMADRGRYVSACLIIVRAYLTAGTPDLLAPIASFDDWSRLVRSALVWLGCADPAKSMERAREDDPELTDLREFVAAWRDCSEIGIGKKLTTKDMASVAEEKTRDAHGQLTTYPQHHDWFDCLNRLAGERGVIKTVKLGNWLRIRDRRIVDGLQIKKGKPAHGGVSTWEVCPVK